MWPPSVSCTRFHIDVVWSRIPQETSISFPVEKYPEKIKSSNLDKTPSYSGVLKGVKGQYLIFEDGTVFNVRNWEGYVVEFKMEETTND